MALGVTGIIRPSTVDLNDIEIFYSFTPNRITESTDFIPLETSDVLSKRLLSPDFSNLILQGMYTLKLSASVFNKIGYYTILIRPKQTSVTIVDCGVLSQLPDQKGIILNTNTTQLQELGQKLNPGGLCGFRIEYIDNNGQIIPNLFSTVAYSNRCEVITQPSNSSSQKSVVYRFNDTGSLLFLSVTPASSPSIKPNAFPYIGVAGQEILLSNSYFDPQVIDIELTEYDLKKIALLVNGERTINVETGIENIYDENRNILEQSTLYDVKDEFGNPLYKIKENNTTIDTEENWDTITENIS
jgi:hypothetical protein